MTTFGVSKLRPARVLHADPPWRFADALPGMTRGASRNYATMSFEQVMATRLPPLAENCLLFLWRVSAMQAEALAVMQAWQFELKTEIVWRKLTSQGNEHFGMGRYVRAAHETCLIGVRGRVKVRSHSVRSLFSAAVGRHSQKPEEIFRIAQRLSPGPYTEIFGRAPRAGWQVCGNDASLLWEAA